jgi:hypothetical protein
VNKNALSEGIEFIVLYWIVYVVEAPKVVIACASVKLVTDAGVVVCTTVVPEYVAIVFALESVAETEEKALEGIVLGAFLTLLT